MGKSWRGEEEATVSEKKQTYAEVCTAEPAQRRIRLEGNPDQWRIYGLRSQERVEDKS